MMHRRDKIRIVSSIVLIFVLFFIVVKGAGNIINKTKPIQSEKKKTFLKGDKDSQKDTGVFSKLDIETKDLELRLDPFFAKPIPPKKISTHGLKLRGIVWDEKKPMALINDRTAGVGDTIEGNVIIEIKQDKVILNDGFKDFALKLE